MKWSGASHWTRVNDRILEFEEEQRQYRERRASIIHDSNSLTDEMESNLPNITEDDMEGEDNRSENDRISQSMVQIVREQNDMDTDAEGL